MPLNHNNMGIGSAVGPVTNSEMQSAIDRYKAVTCVLINRVEELTKKLQPVLRIESPQTNSKSTEPSSTVPIIQQIDTEAEKLACVARTLTDLLERLPL